MKKNTIIIIAAIIIFTIIVIILLSLSSGPVNNVKKPVSNGEKKENIATTKSSQKEEKEEYLKEEELEEFENFFNKTENNGFILSEYENPDEIDLYEVLYSGAGIEQKELTAEEELEFKEGAHVDEIEMNITAIKKEKIEELYFKKTGTEIKDIKSRLPDWGYLEKSGLYCLEHSDTNYSPVEECRIGTKKGDIYTVYVTFEDSQRDHAKVTLKKQGDDYIFISNEFIE